MLTSGWVQWSHLETGIWVEGAAVAAADGAALSSRQVALLWQNRPLVWAALEAAEVEPCSHCRWFERHLSPQPLSLLGH